MPKKRKSPKKRERHAGLASRPIVVFLSCLLLVSAGTVGFSYLVEKITPPCANSISCVKDLSGAYESEKKGIFMGQKVVVPSDLALDMIQKQVLGQASGPKHISVDLTNQKLYAHEGKKVVLAFPVSTGKWGRTPTGDFKIWIKLRFTRMSGGSGNDYYNLPNVPHVMFFYNNEVSKSRGFSLHGAYWHNNFGYPMSHGCVNIRPEDAAKLYEWADPATSGRITYAGSDNPGTQVTIYGEPPL